MINVIRDRPDPATIASALASAHPTPHLPPRGSSAWQHLAALEDLAPFRRSLQELSVADRDSPTPTLSQAAYREFYKSGGRAEFESAYFERRRRIARLAASALLATGPNPWIPQLEREIRAVLDEFSWALPAHVNSPSGQDPAEIDTLAADTALLLAETAALLWSDLTPDLASEIRWRLRWAFVENYLRRYDDFWWTRAGTHANAVCHAGVLAAAFVAADDPELLAPLVARAGELLGAYLDGFNSDGGCTEGPAYWQYGFGRFCLANEWLEARSGGQLSLAHGDPLVTEIGRYGVAVSLEGYHFVDFGDSPPTGAFAPSLLSQIAERFRIAEALPLAERNYLRLARSGFNLKGQHADLPLLARLLLRWPDELPDAPPPLPPLDAYLPDLGVVVTRFRDERGHLWEFAAKGGNNAEYRNHNDCGTFLLHLDGLPIFPDFGQPTYPQDAIKEHRYQHLAARTSGHPLPLVNGAEQEAGRSFAARILTCESTEDHLEFTVELTGCYPESAGCGDLVRSFFLDKKRGRLRVRETFELAVHRSLETAVLTSSEVILRERSAEIVDGNLHAAIYPLEETEILTLEELEYRDATNRPRSVSRIVLVPARLEGQKAFGYEIEMLEA
jgi:hypothetical protein